MGIVILGKDIMGIDILALTRPTLHQLTSIDQFWSIDWDGYNRLKPLVKTAPGFNHPTLV